MQTLANSKSLGVFQRPLQLPQPGQNGQNFYPFHRSRFASYLGYTVLMHTALSKVNPSLGKRTGLEK